MIDVGEILYHLVTLGMSSETTFHFGWAKNTKGLWADQGNDAPALPNNLVAGG